MGEPVLTGQEQGRQIHEKLQGHAVACGQHGQQALLGKDHVGQAVIGGGCGAHEVDGGLGIARGESRVAKIGKGGVGRADGPVQRIQVEGPMQGEGVRAGIDVGQDVLRVDGQERVPVQTGG